MFFQHFTDQMSRNKLGLPAAWSKILFWLSYCTTGIKIRPAAEPVYAKKCPEIPVLSNYGSVKNKNFWSVFPKFKPKKPKAGGVRFDVLHGFVQKCRGKWTCHQQLTADRCLKIMANGAMTELVRPLGPLAARNTKSALVHGELMTDTIATWVKKRMVVGPFRKAPLKNFRANPLMAVAQRNKVRPILNLSSPEGSSFNDAVNELAIPKLRMSSARLFGEALWRAGHKALFAKYDIQDAYKLIPGHPDQWHCFGFKWLGRFFYDITTVFGSKSAPANFDVLPDTVLNVVSTLAGTPSWCLHRQLDDVPIVSASGSGITERFAETYLQVCKEIGIPLAESCPDREKAFGPGCQGTVLGTKFDSEKMSWSWAAEKVDRALNIIDEFLVRRTCTLKEAQKLHGKLSDFAQMCNFMNGFRYHLVKMLAAFDGQEGTKRFVTVGLKRDLWVWKKCISAVIDGFPIPEPAGLPPVTAIRFISDAAGSAMRFENGIWINATVPGDQGVASIGFTETGPNFCGGFKWPFSLLTRAKDENGTWMGSKSTFLECVGLLIPFLTEPNMLKNKYVILEVDNINLVYGWEKKHCKNDQHASILLRCLHVLEARLECKVHVHHTRRMSNPMAALADKLSRSATTTRAELDQIEGLEWHVLKGPLADWLADPALDWELPLKLLDSVEQILAGGSAVATPE
jgi:hypothetical protein